MPRSSERNLKSAPSTPRGSNSASLIFGNGITTQPGRTVELDSNRGALEQEASTKHKKLSELSVEFGNLKSSANNLPDQYEGSNSIHASLANLITNIANTIDEYHYKFDIKRKDYPSIIKGACFSVLRYIRDTKRYVNKSGTLYTLIRKVLGIDSYDKYDKENPGKIDDYIKEYEDFANSLPLTLEKEEVHQFIKENGELIPERYISELPSLEAALAAYKLREKHGETYKKLGTLFHSEASVPFCRFFVELTEDGADTQEFLTDYLNSVAYIANDYAKKRGKLNNSDPKQALLIALDKVANKTSTNGNKATKLQTSAGLILAINLTSEQLYISSQQGKIHSQFNNEGNTVSKAVESVTRDGSRARDMTAQIIKTINQKLVSSCNSEKDLESAIELLRKTKLYLTNENGHYNGLKALNNVTEAGSSDRVDTRAIGAALDNASEYLKSILNKAVVIPDYKKLVTEKKNSQGQKTQTTFSISNLFSWKKEERDAAEESTSTTPSIG